MDGSVLSLDELVARREHDPPTEEMLYDALGLRPVEIVSETDTHPYARITSMMVQGKENLVDYFLADRSNAALTVTTLSLGGAWMLMLPPMAPLYGLVAGIGMIGQYMSYRKYKAERKELHELGWDDYISTRGLEISKWMPMEDRKWLRLASGREGYGEEFDELMTSIGLDPKTLKRPKRRR